MTRKSTPHQRSAVAPPTHRPAGRKSSPSTARGGSPKTPRPWRTAKNSDRRELYELSVQEPTSEVTFFDRVYRERNRRLPRSLREDFCGSAAVSAEWVRRRPANTALGVDLDPAILAWANQRAVAPLTPGQQRRIRLVRGNVLRVDEGRADILAALNFSYSVFKVRKDLVGYLTRCRKRLAPGGLLVMDCYGGSQAHAEVREDRILDGFTYVWDQFRYNPITGHVLNHIHFEFPDGSQLKQAFTYDWRLWSIPELRDALADAGFGASTVYWEGTNHRDGPGNGKFNPSERGEACEGWIAYIVVER